MEASPSKRGLSSGSVRTFEEESQSMLALSVIISTSNRCDSLRSTLECLEQMTIPEGFGWEVLVVDNNSRDNTKAMVEEFTRTSAFRVRYVFEAQQGVSSARN